jgi:hypothetical protein
MSDWRELYAVTVLQTEPAQMQFLMQETEAAIFDRLQELERDSNGAGERREIADALSALLVLKKERLGWPDLESRRITDSSSIPMAQQ